MGKAWRWNKQSFKRTVLDAVLDKVVRDLFSVGDRPHTRKIGGAASAKKPRRQNFSLEAIEPRLLLSADISYVNPLAHEYTLQATGADSLTLFETGTATVAGTATLTDNSITIKRAGGSIIQGAIGDTVHIDLNSFSTLNGFVGSGGNFTINFTGGDQSLFEDKVTLDGSATLGFGLAIKSDSAIASNATASFNGDLSLEVTEKSTGFLNSDKAVFAKTNAEISITGATLSADTISLTATSDLTGITTNGFSLGPVDAKVIVALATTSVSILGGSHLTATSGDVTISAITKVGTAAADAADDSSDTDDTKDAVIAVTTVT
ncbi:MAG: LEPR-XLL domain-containing protein, partial [Bradyrhizobium sp.]